MLHNKRDDEISFHKYDFSSVININVWPNDDKVKDLMQSYTQVYGNVGYYGKFIFFLKKNTSPKPFFFIFRI